MAVASIARDFDQISRAYDATREPIAAETLAALVRELRARGVDRLLEVGVGTGRVAAPLRAAGFRIVGLDASPGMMAKARRKGIDRLVRGDALRLPFPNGVFSAALFVHFLHIVDDPARAIAEAIRVARGGAFALVHPHPPSDPGIESPPRRLRELLAAEGYRPGAPAGGPGRRERELLRTRPPDELIPLSDHLVREPPARQLEAVLARAHRFTLTVPPEVLERAVAQVRRELGDAEIEHRQVEALAHWTRAVPDPDPPS